MAKATSEEILASEHSSLLVDLRYVKSDQTLSSSEETLEAAEALILLQEAMIVALKSTLAAVRAESMKCAICGGHGTLGVLSRPCKWCNGTGKAHQPADRAEWPSGDPEV
jgi:hypothetical protein